MIYANIDKAAIDAVLASFDSCTSPGVAVGVALRGRPMYRAGYGLANIEQPLVLTASTRMHIASTTKHFASLAYLLLCEEGRAALDDPLVRYIPEVHPVIASVTMRALMSHTAGIRDAADMSGVLCGIAMPVTMAELVAWYSDIDDVNAAPGETWVYCNGGYILLSAAIERLSGMKLEDFLTERIFAPVGMHDTLLRRFDERYVERSAALHLPADGGGFERAARSVEGVGQGGIASTVDDLLRWLAHMDAPVVGSAESWRQLTEVQRLHDGTSTGYALGLMRGQYRGLDTIAHHGGVVGATSQMLKIPQIEMDIVVLANRNDVSAAALAYEIIDACLPDIDASHAQSAATARAGLYRDPINGDVLKLSVCGDGVIALIDSGEIAFREDGSGVLMPVATASHFKYRLRPEGEILVLERFGAARRYHPVQPRPGADIAPYLGVYRHAATRTSASVMLADGTSSLLCEGSFGRVIYRLEPLTDTVWQARRSDQLPWSVQLMFDASLNGFSLISPRTNRLKFVRV